MIQQIDDLRAEAAELHRFLTLLRPGDWSRATQFKAWTFDDILRHLHIGDIMALTSASSAGAFAELMADIRREREKSPSRVEEARRRLNGLGGPALLERWRGMLEKLCDTLSAKPPETRLAWAGPDMGLRMFTTARQMETWSHAQAIYDVMGVERPPPAPRLRNVAEIGVRTFGWAYRNRGLAVPPLAPSIRLSTPFGETWEWKASDSDSVEGDAVSFCQIATQTRNVADTSLVVRGETAKQWMTIIQCFAGQPETPPSPGTRYRSKASSAPAPSP
ncbi:MAG: TIGR03084 family metal-binding protein [Reyranella sp.]|uniref:TIGR03084 family metal-binding protein n=1 Tax=Reyranella sp. TaxID=1929291 RepID=UPI003D0E75CD